MYLLIFYDTSYWYERFAILFGQEIPDLNYLRNSPAKLGESVCLDSLFYHWTRCHVMFWTHLQTLVSRDPGLLLIFMYCCRRHLWIISTSHYLGWTREVCFDCHAFFIYIPSPLPLSICVNTHAISEHNLIRTNLL